MPQFSYDAYDPDEIRRRRIMDPLGDSEDMMPPVMPEDEGDQEPDVSAASSVRLTPAQEKYKATLDSMPPSENYKPSKMRRFGAALAGGLAGLRDPKMGFEIGQNISSAPYQGAMNEWQAAVNRDAAGAGLEDKAAARDIASRRAGAYERGAAAREKAASATEAWRRSQEMNQPWHPKTKEEAMEFEASKRTPPAAPRPTAFEEYMKNPEGYQKYLKDLQAGKTQPLTFEQRKQLQSQRDSAAMARQNARAKTGTKPPPLASPLDQQRAEQQAIDQVLRTSPYAKNYADFVEAGDPAKKIPHRLKGAHEIDSLKPNSGWFPWSNNTSESQARINKDLYANFLSEVNRAKKQILSSRREPDESPWDEPDEDEDDQ